jgi:hypothetical protein
MNWFLFSNKNNARGNQEATPGGQNQSNDERGGAAAKAGVFALAGLAVAGWLKAGDTFDNVELPKRSLLTALGLSQPEALVPALTPIGDAVAVSSLTDEFLWYKVKTASGETLTIPKDAAYVFPPRDDQPTSSSITKCTVNDSKEAKYYIVWNGELSDATSQNNSMDLTNKNTAEPSSVAAAGSKNQNGPSGTN